MPPPRPAAKAARRAPPPDQAAILKRLESHARAFFGSSSSDEEAAAGAGPPPAGQGKRAHAGPDQAAACLPADGSPSSSDARSGDGFTSSDSEGEAGGCAAATAGPPNSDKTTTTRRPAVVVIAGPGGGGGTGPARPGPPAVTTAGAPPADLKAQRKALMSGRADVTGGGPLPAWQKGLAPRPARKRRGEAPAATGGAAAAAASGAAGAAADPGATPTKAEFAAMRREVEEFGVANLDKRARAAAEARRLAALGFPAAKGPRIPASIGLGMAAKQKSLAAAALEAAIDAGLVSRSGLGKKKRRAAEAARRAAGTGGAGDLDGSGPLRNGVLFVREAPAKKRKGPGGGRRFNIDKIKL